MLCHQVIAILEDTSVTICRAISSSAATVRFISGASGAHIVRASAAAPSSSDSNSENRESVSSHAIITGVKQREGEVVGDNEESEGAQTAKEEAAIEEERVLSRIIKPSCYPTHAELSNVPISNIKDIQLLLVLSRALSSGQRVENEPQLPAMLLDCTEPLPTGDLNVSKAILMVTLSLACLDEYKKILDLYENESEIVGRGGSEVRHDVADRDARRVGGVNMSSSSSSSATAFLFSSSSSSSSTAAITAPSAPSSCSAMQRNVLSGDESAGTTNSSSAEVIRSRDDTATSLTVAKIRSRRRIIESTEANLNLRPFSYLVEKSADILKRILSGDHSASESGDFRVHSDSNNPVPNPSVIAGSTSESLPENINWLNSSKAIELVSACLHMSCCPFLVDRCVTAAVDTMEALLTAHMYYDIDHSMKMDEMERTEESRSSRDLSRCAQEEVPLNYEVDENNEENVKAAPVARERRNAALVIAELLSVVFERVSSSRPAVLTSLLKGMLVCGDHVLYGQKSRSCTSIPKARPRPMQGMKEGHDSTQNRSNNRNYGSKNPSDDVDQSHELQSQILSFANTVFHLALSSLCSKQPKMISGMASILDTYVPLLSLLPMPTLGCTLFPIMRIAGHDQGTPSYFILFKYRIF